jgi:hypothetical protein
MPTVRARRRKKNIADDEVWLSEPDQIALEEHGLFDLSDEDLERNKALLDDYFRADRVDLRSILSFIPWVPTVYLGGVYTILRFAAHFAREHRVESRFCIYDVAPQKALCVTHVRHLHHEGMSRGGYIDPADFARSEESYGAFRTVGDPFYNPNLTLAGTDCALSPS